MFKLKITLIALIGLASFAVHSQTAITAVTLNAVPATPSTSTNQMGAPYGVHGTFSASTAYTINYGQGQDQHITSITVGGVTHNEIELVDKLEIRVRTDLPTTNRMVSMNRAINISGNTINLESSKANTTEEALLSNLINRGADAIFNNTKYSIERLDYMFNSPKQVSNAADLSVSGFSIFERGGGAIDPIQIVAILGVDGAGIPNCFGTPVNVIPSDYGGSVYSGGGQDVVVHKDPSDSDFRPHGNYAGDIQGVFITLADLGLSVNQDFYGYALFDTNVNPSNNACNTDLIDWESYPNGDASSIDLVAGGMLYSTKTNIFEVCDNGIDDDGDGLIDCADPDCPCPPTQTVCNDNNSDVFSINPVAGANSYEWTLTGTGGGTIVSGQGTTSITVDWTSGTIGQDTEICVKSLNGATCVSPNTCQTVTITSCCTISTPSQIVFD